MGASSDSVSADQQMLLRRMLRIRQFEEKTQELFRDGEIPGFVHLYIGQEAVAVGAASALDEDDFITSTHRGHGHCVARGLDLTGMFAELMGKSAGFCNGKGGSMHIADVEAGMLGANGIVGSGAPLATGAGLSKHVTGTAGVGLAFYGDGGVSQGQVHESINMAAAWDLPVVYLVEKNSYVENMPASSVFNHLEYADFAAGYDIKGVEVDGMDPVAVQDAVSAAKKRAEDREGPSIVVAETYRFVEHSEGTPDDRPEEERAQWKERDPIRTFRDRLIDADVLSMPDYEQLDQEVTEAVAAAAEEAKTLPEAPADAAYEDVFTDPAPDIEYHRQNMETQ